MRRFLNNRISNYNNVGDKVDDFCEDCENRWLPFSRVWWDSTEKNIANIKRKDNGIFVIKKILSLINSISESIKDIYDRINAIEPPILSEKLIELENDYLEVGVTADDKQEDLNIAIYENYINLKNTKVDKPLIESTSDSLKIVALDNQGESVFIKSSEVGKVKSVNNKIGDVILKTSDLENDSDYTTNLKLNQERDERISGDNLKLDKPTTSGTTTTHPNIVGVDDLGNSAKLKASDFGKVKSVNGKEGDVILKTSDLENDSDYTTNATLTAHTSNKSNPHNVTKSQIGLGNVDNTSDINKPISTATQTELNKKLDKPTINNTPDYVLLADGSTAPKNEFGNVKTVNGKSPDSTGNTDIGIDDTLRVDNITERIIEFEDGGITLDVIDEEGLEDKKFFAYSVREEGKFRIGTGCGSSKGGWSAATFFGWGSLIKLNRNNTTTKSTELSAYGYNSLKSFEGGDNGGITSIGANTLFNFVGTNDPQPAYSYFMTALGTNALYDFLDGSRNTALGGSSGRRLVTGSYNTFTGSASMQELKEGSNNTAIGCQVTSKLKKGSNNTFIGANLQLNEEEVNDTVIIADGTGKQHFKSDDKGSILPSQTIALIDADETGKAIITKEFVDSKISNFKLPTNWTNENHQWSNLPDKSSDATYNKVMVLDNNGKAGTKDAGDLGKNFSNTDLEITENRKHTGTASVELAMPMIYSNASQRFSGLVDKSADATYNALMGLDSQGNAGKLTALGNVLESGLQTISSAQALRIGQLLNGGQGSSGAISVNLISPPIVQNRFDSVEYVLLMGANLLLNSTDMSISICDENKNVIQQIPNNQIINNSASELIFYYNFYQFATGTHYIKITSGVKVYYTTLDLRVVQEVENINFNEITWEKVYAENVTAPSVDEAINQNVIQRAVGANGNTTNVLSSFKSSELFALGENFSIEYMLTLNQITPRGGGVNTARVFTGLGYSNTPNALINNSIIYHHVSGTGTNYNQIGINGSVYDKGLVTPHNTIVTITKVGNLFRITIGSVTRSFTLSNNSGYSMFIQSNGSSKGLEQQIQITKAFKFN